MSETRERPRLAHVFVGEKYVREIYQVPEDPSLSCEMVICATSAAESAALQLESAGQDSLLWKDEARDVNILASRILIPESSIGPVDLVLLFALIVCIISLRVLL